jgi:hypothetical protein
VLLAALGDASAVQAQVAPRNITLMKTYPNAPSAVEGYLNGRAEMGYAMAANVSAQADVIKAHAEILKAQAMMVESWGKAAESHARASELREKARSAAFDNEVKGAQAFFDKRKVRETYIAAHARKPRATTGPSYSNSFKNLKRLERYEFDPTRGRIHWPAILQRDEFEEYRVDLECLFAQGRPIESGPGGDFEKQVRESAGGMRSKLRDLVQDVPSAQYAAACRFIEGLILEARFPRQMEDLAAN